MIKNNVKLVLTLLLFLVTLASCSNRYMIEGVTSVTSFDGKMLYFKTFNNSEWVAVDSAEVVHGIFTTSAPLDSVMMVTLYMNDDAIMPIVLERGTIEVDLSNSMLSAKGTPLNNALYEFIKKKNELELKIEELERKEARMVLDGAVLEDIHEQLTKEADVLIKDMNEYVVNFITTNYENVLGPNVFMMMCSTLPYPVITSQIEAILLTAPESFKNVPMVREFIDTAKENMKRIEERKRMSESEAVKN